MTEQDLRLNIKAQGGDKAAGEVAKVTDAQAKLGKATGSTAKPTKLLTEEQKKLNAAEGDYIALLTQANPQLGGLVDGLLKAVKISGDFANKQIDLTKIGSKLTSVLTENANAFKLLGAGGIAAIGVAALAGSIESLIQQSERLRQQLEKFREERDEAELQLINEAKGITRISDDRREGAFTGNESIEAERAFIDIVGKGRVEDRELLKRNIAGLIGIRTAEEIEKLTATGFQTSLDSSLRGREASSSSHIRRRDTDEAFSRQADRIQNERTARATAALKELDNVGDITNDFGNLREFLGNTPQVPGSDPDLVMEIIRRFAELKQVRDRNPNQMFELEPSAGFANLRNAGNVTDEEVLGRAGFESESFLRRFFDVRSQVAILSEATAKQMIDAMNTLADRMDRQDGGISTTVIQAPNSTFNGPGVTRRDLTVNGETELDAIRGGF